MESGECCLVTVSAVPKDRSVRGVGIGGCGEVGRVGCLFVGVGDGVITPT